MRLWAWLGLVALGLGGCAHWPERVKVDVDGHSVEVGRTCASSAP